MGMGEIAGAEEEETGEMECGGTHYLLSRKAAEVRADLHQPTAAMRSQGPDSHDYNFSFLINRILSMRLNSLDNQ